MKHVEKDCTLALGDCMTKLSEVKTSSADLILTDPPYNLGLFMKNRETNLGALRENHFVATNWDDLSQNEWAVCMDGFFKESARVLKKRSSMIVFMSLIKIETLVMIAQKHGFYYKTTGIWHKKNPMPRNMNLHFINSTEAWIYFTYGSKTATFNNNGKALHDFVETSTIGLKEKKHGKHPTQKPVELMEHFINTLSNENDLVLDPFMGSGSTGVAAIKNRRRFHGIELEEGYYKLSLDRISAVLEDKK